MWQPISLAKIENVANNINNGNGAASVMCQLAYQISWRNVMA